MKKSVSIAIFLITVSLLGELGIPNGSKNSSSSLSSFTWCLLTPEKVTQPVLLISQRIQTSGWVPRRPKVPIPVALTMPLPHGRCRFTIAARHAVSKQMFLL